jgi:glycosyltransferase involved in cell wall biosynthesis
MKESSRLVVVEESSYPLKKDSPDGVKDVIVGLRPLLERKGCKIILIGPSIKKNEDNLADYTFGTTIKVNHDDTTTRMAVSFRGKGRAESLMRVIRPDIVVIHEPFAAPATHTMISGMPKRRDGKNVPAIIGHFHAQTEDLSGIAKAAKALIRVVRRPQFSEFGVPTGFTSGYLATIVNALSGRIAVSNATAEFWQQQIGGEFKVIYNGINIEEMNPNGPKIEAWNDGTKTILAAARHDPRKGLEYGIRAINLLVRAGRRDIKLKITGKGQETGRLKALVKELGLENFVEFLGILNRETLAMAYRSADVFISPATGGEGFGRTLAEALSSGTLVVASDINGYREVMQGKPFTRMVEPRNVPSLANGIDEMMELPEDKKERLKKDARQHVIDSFSLDEIADQTIAYYEERLLAHGRPTEEEWDFGRKRKLPRFGIIFSGKK